MSKFIFVMIAFFGISANVLAADWQDLFGTPQIPMSVSGGYCAAYQDNGSTGAFCAQLTTAQQCQNYGTICAWIQR